MLSLSFKELVNGAVQNIQKHRFLCQTAPTQEIRFPEHYFVHEQNIEVAATVLDHPIQMFLMKVSWDVLAWKPMHIYVATPKQLGSLSWREPTPRVKNTAGTRD